MPSIPNIFVPPVWYRLNCKYIYITIALSVSWIVHSGCGLVLSLVVTWFPNYMVLNLLIRTYECNLILCDVEAHHWDHLLSTNIQVIFRESTWEVSFYNHHHSSKKTAILLMRFHLNIFKMAFLKYCNTYSLYGGKNYSRCIQIWIQCTHM